MAIQFYRKKVDGQPDQLINAKTQKVLTPQEFNGGAGYQELKAIDGAKYNTKELQQADYSNISAFGNTLYGLEKQKTITSSDLTAGTGLPTPPEPTASITQKSFVDATLRESGSALEKAKIQLEQYNKNQAEMAKYQAEADKLKADKQTDINEFQDKINPIQDKLINKYGEATDVLNSINLKAKYAEIEKHTNTAISLANSMNDEIQANNARGGLSSVNSGINNSIVNSYTSKITAEQVSASMLADNVTIAFDWVDRGAKTVNDSLADQQQFLSYVSQLYDNDILKAEINLDGTKTKEAEQIKERLAEIEADMAKVEASKTLIKDLMNSEPTIMSKAGLEFTDTEEEILQKVSDYYAKNPNTKLSISEQLALYEKGVNIDADGKLYQGTVSIPTGTLASKNNNPGNLRFVGQAGATQGEGGFARFATPEAGYQALIRQIQLDQSRGLTLGEFITKYAPPSENNTELYIAQAEPEIGLSRDGLLANADPDTIARFMAKKESGTTIAGGDEQITANNEAYSLAQSIFNGSSNQKLSDISTANNLRGNVSLELDKMKQEALSSGNVQGIIRASAGGKDVDSTFIQSFEKALNVIGQLGDIQKSIDGEATGPIWGTIRKNNPYDVKAQQIKAQLTALVPNLARGVYGEVGVLTDNDIKLYSQTLPNLQSEEELRKALLGITVKSVMRSLENKIKTAAGFGRDVSGILDTYNQYEEMSNTLLSNSINKQSLPQDKVQEALNSGYSSDDIVSYLQNDPVYSSKISEAQKNGYTNDEILEYLQLN